MDARGDPDPQPVSVNAKEITASRKIYVSLQPLRNPQPYHRLQTSGHRLRPLGLQPTDAGHPQ